MAFLELGRKVTHTGPCSGRLDSGWGGGSSIVLYFIRILLYMTAEWATRKQVKVHHSSKQDRFVSAATLPVWFVEPQQAIQCSPLGLQRPDARFQCSLTSNAAGLAMSGA